MANKMHKSVGDDASACLRDSKLKVQNSQLTRLVRAQDEVITLQKQEINLYRKLIEQIMRNNTSANCIAKKNKIANAR